MIKREVSEIWKEYDEGMSYKGNLNLYETVKRNNDFYNDKQWEGVNAPDLDKPVFNILKPAINYYVAMLITDDIGVSIKKTDGTEEEPSKVIEKILSDEIEKIFENTKFEYTMRKSLKTSAIDGDVALYVYYDEEAETGEMWNGKINIEAIDNTNIIFGNPMESDIQQQPYIIIVSRKLTEEVKAEAEENGQSTELIKPDTQSQNTSFDSTQEGTAEYTTVLTKFWKENGTILFKKTTEKAVLKEEQDTELSIYPVAWFTWEKVKNSYHGNSPITGRIQNQIFVNKIYAMAMEYQKQMAFPKIIFDKTKIKNYSNKIGEAIAVAGDPREAIFANHVNANMNSQAIELAINTIEKTRESMGVYDTALGNARPDNTSAIIALQKASSLPLDIQKHDYYQFIEDCIRIMFEYMTKFYGIRDVLKDVTHVDPNTGEEIQATILESFNFAELEAYKEKLIVDIGGSAYFSEITQIQTLDNLMNMGLIPDPTVYLEAIPSGYIKNKQEIIKSIKDFQDKQEQQQALQQGLQPTPEDYVIPDYI